MNLSELIINAKGDRSYAQLSRACGGNPTAARIFQMVDEKLKEFPRPSTLKGLSQGLGVSEKAIVLAAAESLGLRIDATGSLLETLLPEDTEALTSEQIGLILGMVRQLLNVDTSGDMDPPNAVDPPAGEMNLAH